MTYSGVLRTIYSIDPDGDSIFQVGVADPVQDHKSPLPLFIQPGPKTNAGRYINHGKSGLSANCSPFMGLIVTKEGNIEICVYIYTNRPIREGE